MEDDDPVVQEIPVFLSQALSDHLYVYQYPVKPSNRDWNKTKVMNARIKPRNNLVRLEVGLDTYSDKYCSSKGEQIAINTDGQQDGHRSKDSDPPYFRSGQMDRVVYESLCPGSQLTHYAVAVLQGKELHCTPVKGIIQLRPTCSYLDRQNKSKKEDKSDEEGEPDTQQVTVKFGRQESELAKKAREKSYEFVSKKTLEESWYDAMYRHDHTDFAELERLKLLSLNSGEGSRVCLDPAQYVRALVPQETVQADLPTVADVCLQVLHNGGRQGGPAQCGQRSCDLLADPVHLDPPRVAVRLREAAPRRAGGGAGQRVRSEGEPVDPPHPTRHQLREHTPGYSTEIPKVLGRSPAVILGVSPGDSPETSGKDGQPQGGRRRQEEEEEEQARQLQLPGHLEDGGNLPIHGYTEPRTEKQCFNTLFNIIFLSLRVCGGREASSIRPHI